MFPAECRPSCLAAAELSPTITASLLTKSYTFGRYPAKNPNATSYNPGASVVITEEPFSHAKFSGQVLTIWISHGTYELARGLPLYQIHRPEQFS